MQLWQRAAFLSILAWLLAVGIWANRSWTESVPLTTPPNVEEQTRSFVCHAPLGAKGAEPRQSEGRQYPLSREPCDVHGERRAIAIFDMGFGVALLVLLIYLGTRRSTNDDPVPAGMAG